MMPFQLSVNGLFCNVLEMNTPGSNYFTYWIYSSHTQFLYPAVSNERRWIFFTLWSNAGKKKKKTLLRWEFLTEAHR